MMSVCDTFDLNSVIYITKAKHCYLLLRAHVKSVCVLRLLRSANHLRQIVISTSSGNLCLCMCVCMRVCVWGVRAAVCKDLCVCVWECVPLCVRGYVWVCDICACVCKREGELVRMCERKRAYDLRWISMWLVDPFLLLNTISHNLANSVHTMIMMSLCV